MGTGETGDRGPPGRQPVGHPRGPETAYVTAPQPKTEATHAVDYRRRTVAAIKLFAQVCCMKVIVNVGCYMLTSALIFSYTV